MHDFIRSLASSLSVPGLSPRAVTLFYQAMTKGRCRWGRRAKLVAAAALAIALRESGKPDLLRDIAFLIGETDPAALSRSFTRVLSLLGLSPLLPTDPASHFPALQAHLQTFLRPGRPEQPSAPLPKALVSSLARLPLTSVLETANSLSIFVSRAGSKLALNALSTPPTACALIILALEAEVRSSLPHLSELAAYLGARFGAGKGVVMARYKIIYDLFEEWIEEVPWLENFSPSSWGARAKTAKRTVVARGLKDVLQFQDDIWKKKLESLGLPKLDLEHDSEGDSDEDTDEDADRDAGEGCSPNQKSLAKPPLAKKRKTRAGPLDDASRFLLDPLSCPVSSGSTRSSTSHRRSVGRPPPLTTYLLIEASAALTTRFAPTRLQLLCMDRPGGEADVGDDELFGEDELEGLLRSGEEAEQMKNSGLLGWKDDDEDMHVDRETSESDILMKTAIGGMKEWNSVRTNRVDMAALARVLSGDFDLSDEAMVDEFENELPRTHNANTPDTELEGIEDWRPPSPGIGCSLGDGFGVDRYEQEY
jgi:transcription factor IIIB 90 kDa subunit